MSDTEKPAGEEFLLREDKARAVAERVGTLPLLPGAVTRLLRVDPDSDAYFDELVSISSSEPNLAVRVLRCANSAFSAPAQPITSVAQAAQRIGSNRCGQLALAVSVAQVFVPRTPQQRELWAHSLRVASLSELIARANRARTEICEAAYTAGLVHDIGRFAMFGCMTTDFNRVAEADWDTPQALLEAEEKLLGYDHTRVGELICEHWGLPLPLIEIVRDHHLHTMGTENPDADAPDVATIQLADCVSMCVESHPEILQTSSEERAIALGDVVQATIAAADTEMHALLAERLPKVERHIELVLSDILGLSVPDAPRN